MSPSRVAFEAPGGVLDAVVSSLLGDATFPLAAIFAGIDHQLDS
jgi:hypothetical protein